MNTQTVAVLGLGLIGGSLARDLSARGARVLGYDVDADTLLDAQRAGVLEGVLGESLTGLAQVDTAIVAVPVRSAGALLARMRPRLQRHTLVMDVSSTQRGSAAAAARLGLERSFVGTHPLAGDHRGGWSTSRAGLFAGARVFLCAAVRIAASPAGLWTDIARENADELLAVLPRLRDELARLEEALRAGDDAALREVFEAAAAWARAT